MKYPCERECLCPPAAVSPGGMSLSRHGEMVDGGWWTHGLASSHVISLPTPTLNITHNISEQL